jgi:hypothetical protein
MVQQNYFRRSTMQKSRFYLLSEAHTSVKLENKIVGRYHYTFTKIILLVHL